MSRLSAQGVFALVLFLVVATVAALPAYPLKKSANGHYLVDQNNQPFLMIGDSPQSIIANVSTSNGDMQTYFHNRATNGINAALVMLICGDYTFGSPNLLSQNGLAPFTGTVSVVGRTLQRLTYPIGRMWISCSRSRLVTESASWPIRARLDFSITNIQ